MHGQETFRRFVEKYPHDHRTFFSRPHWTRRQFFEVVGAGLTASFVSGTPAPAASVEKAASVTAINKAKNVIFILLAGAPSHTDTFDFKVVPGVTPDNFNKSTIGGIDWPAGLLPKLADQIPNFAIVRSMRAWALVHSLAQTWTQIGRNPAAALGNVAPNIGSIVAIERAEPGKIFPTFLALNSNAAAGAGYLSAQYGPFKLAPSTAGIPSTTNPDGSARLDERWSLLHALDDPLRINSPLGRPPQDYDNFYKSAKGLMYNPVVDQAFKFSTADSARYGGTPFGNACLVAKKVLEANQGTRFIQITQGGWDMHLDIYGKQNPRGSNIYTMGKLLDDGFSALLADMKSSGLLNETLVVMVGEFGRTVGKLSAQQGRDHFVQQFSVFAGAGVTGGRTIGSTKPDGSATDDYGWSRGRDVRPEDVEATIYSALGINWTTQRDADILGRSFEYVPFSDQDLYGPINELWS